MTTLLSIIQKVELIISLFNMSATSKASFEFFIYENMERFIEGYPKSNCYINYNIWAPRCGYTMCSDINKFNENMLRYCNLIEQNPKFNQYVYKLNESARTYFRIDDYQLMIS